MSIVTTYPNYPGIGILNLDTEKSNTVPLTRTIRAVRCMPITGVAGTVKLVFSDGSSYTTEIAKGETIEREVIQVFSTGTTATGLEGIV